MNRINNIRSLILLKLLFLAFFFLSISLSACSQEPIYTKCFIKNYYATVSGSSNYFFVGSFLSNSLIPDVHNFESYFFLRDYSFVPINNENDSVINMIYSSLDFKAYSFIDSISNRMLFDEGFKSSMPLFSDSIGIYWLIYFEGFVLQTGLNNVLKDSKELINSGCPSQFVPFTKNKFSFIIKSDKFIVIDSFIMENIANSIIYFKDYQLFYCE